MAVYHGPQCKLCRREGVKLMLRGERCASEKCAMERRPFPPGMRTTKRRRTSTEYNTQLREKQKIRRMYGVLERQFERYFAAASRAEGVTGERLLQILELRLDNIVYRLGFADSRSQARQLVRHGHITVNGHLNNVPSVMIKAGDTIGWKPNKEKTEYHKQLLESIKGKSLPGWLSLDRQKLVATVVSLPTPQDAEAKYEAKAIVEYYSR